MYTQLQQIACGIIHQPMAPDLGQSVEAGRDDGQGKMSSLPGAGMAGMLVAVVANFDMEGVERDQSLTQCLCCTHGNTFLNGLTVTRA